MISVILPTLSIRVWLLRRCLEAYAATTKGYELIVIPNDDQPCGEAWNKGAEKAQGDYIHFAADDLEPHEGWWEAAIATVEEGLVPAARLYWPDGRLQAQGTSWEKDEPDGTPTFMSRVPFMSREMWEKAGPSIPTHYWTDDWLSYRLRLEGFETVNVHGYAFTHHMADVGRIDYGNDANIYQEYVAGKRTL